LGRCAVRTIITIIDTNIILTTKAIVVIAIADIAFENRPTAWIYKSCNRCFVNARIAADTILARELSPARA